MKTIQEHKNGTLSQVIKTYDEMTAEERTALTIPATNKLSDYETFRVHRNKKGEIIRVVAESFSDTKSEQLKNRTDVVKMFNQIEDAIKTKNVDRDTAYAAAFAELGIN